MKRLITFSIILFSTFCAYAQDVEKTIALDEVTVKAAKVVNKDDGMIIYPTDAQKQASNNGYSILEKLTLAILLSATSELLLLPTPIGVELEFK